MKSAAISFRDYLLYNKHRFLTWYYVIKLLSKHGPYDSIRDLIRYPWLLTFLRVNGLMRRLIKGRSGNYRKAVLLMITNMIAGVVRLSEGIFFRGDRLVLNEDLVPPEILAAMGLESWVPELLGILLPMINPRAMERFIDIAEHTGVPPDVCSLPKATMGMILHNYLPPAIAVVASNLPCDGGMSSYTVIEKKLGVPVFRLDVPYRYTSERAVKYFAGELKRMIAWLEEKTPGRMDWDKLKEICLNRNKMAGYELEMWDMIRARPAPMAAEPVYLSHLWAFNIVPGQPSSAELFREILRLGKENMTLGVGVVKNEKYRALLWNAASMHFLDVFVWAEETYGVSLIIDSLSFNRQSYIDTSTRDSMLEGLGKIIMAGPMARHTHGPVEHYMEDLFYAYKQFDIDMIWMSGHIGCKNTHALNGIVRERCRKEGIPFLVIDFDLADTRIVSHDGIKRQIENFMENVMKAERLDK